MKTRTLRRLGTIILAASTLAGCGLHGKPTVARSKASASVHSSSTGPAPDLDEPSRVVAPGIVEPWGGNVDLSPQESGWIAKVLVQEGERVEAGQVLAVLDDAAQQASVDLARADLAEAEATLAKTLHGATDEERRQTQAEAAASQARAALAQRDAQRSNLLGRNQAISQAEVERANAEAEAVGAIARASEAKKAALERGTRGEDRAAARQRVAAARARLELAEASVARRQVVAPIAATVLLGRFHVGEFFNVGASPLFVLGDMSKLQVRVEVDEIDAFRVNDGAPCALYADDNAKLGDATVSRIAPQMGRRGLPIESPTARADVRVREVFAEAAPSPLLVPGRRVWAHVTARARVSLAVD